MLLRLTSSSAYLRASFSFVCYFEEEFFHSYDSLKPRGLSSIYKPIWPAKFSFHDKHYLFLGSFGLILSLLGFLFWTFSACSLFFLFPHQTLTHFVSLMSWKTQTPQSFQSAVHVLSLSVSDWQFVVLSPCVILASCTFNTSCHIFYRFVHCKKKVCRVAERV